MHITVLIILLTRLSEREACHLSFFPLEKEERQLWSQGTWQRTLGKAGWRFRHQRISWLLEGRKRKMLIVKKMLRTLLDFCRVFLEATLITLITTENPACDAGMEMSSSFDLFFSPSLG